MISERNLMQVKVGFTIVWDHPSTGMYAGKELFFGEKFKVEGGISPDGLAWGTCEADGYNGHVSKGALDSTLWEPTHQVCALMSCSRREPDIYSDPVLQLPHNSLVRVVYEDPKINPFVGIHGGYYVPRKHLISIDELKKRSPSARDFAAECERYRDVTYGWGRNTNSAIDCSGVSYQAMRALGVPSPRNSSDQARELPNIIPCKVIDLETGKWDSEPNLRTLIQRGDLVFFDGEKAGVVAHVGVALMPGTLLHGSGDIEQCVVEQGIHHVLRVREQRGLGGIHKVIRPFAT